MKTYVAKDKDINQKWFVVDAKEKVLGRLATHVAALLRGKHKVVFTPHVDTGDGVIVVNADKIRVTGKKEKQKLYKRFSGYPGGLKLETFEVVMKKDPTRPVRHAVWGMLPKNKLGRKMFKRLKVYAGDKHGHSAQKPEALEV